MSSLMFNVQAGVPIPAGAGGKGRNAKYPFRRMNVGDSFEVGHSARDAANARAAIQYYKKTASGHGKEFTVRHQGDNLYRCWRLK